jgi:hypothetical protein
MIGQVTSARGTRVDGRDGFAQVLRSEWVKFWTVRGWVVSLILAAVLTAGITMALANVGGPGSGSLEIVATGPGGIAVNDNFYFAHRSLAGGGSITVRVTSLADGSFPGHGQAPVPAQPWAKAGIIIKDGTGSGSAYAAVLVTPDHGVRMQYNFTGDIAGLAGPVSVSSPRWLRLVRSGDTVTGYDSADGSQWTMLGTATLAGLPSSVQAGLFAASPWVSRNGEFIVTESRATFDDISLRGRWSPGGWGQCEVGAAYLGGGIAAPPGCVQLVQGNRLGSVTSSGGTVAVAGTGDISPYVESVDIVGGVFKGSLAGMVALIAIGSVFVGSEYRRGMIRTTFASTPRRGRVILAKAIVIGAVAFPASLAGAAIALAVAGPRLRSEGWTSPNYPLVSLGTGTGIRIVLGTAVVLALAAIFALAAAVILRRGAGAIIVAIALFVGPLLIATAVPQTAGALLLGVTPAAAFAVQQGVDHYPQSSAVCSASHGCYPLAAWDGVAVLAAWTVAAFVAAWFVVRGRDA